MFAHWLALFEATTTALFAPELAATFMTKARRIAMSLELAVFHRLGAPPDLLRPPVRPTPPASKAAAPCD
jgi:hypothetical protein